MKIGLYYGSETGNSEMLCEDIEAELGAEYDCHIASLADVDPSTLAKDTFYFFVTSTFGNGDLPSTALPFEEAMQGQKPDLSGVRFAIFGLGRLKGPNNCFRAIRPDPTIRRATDKRHRSRSRRDFNGRLNGARRHKN